MNFSHDARREFLKKAAQFGVGYAAWSTMMGKAFAKYPVSQLETIIPFDPGGGTDRSARIVSNAMSSLLQTNPFRLRHLPGAGSLIAQNALQNAPHDGSTLLITPIPHVAWLSELKGNEFKANQIAWLGSYFTDPNVLIVKKDSPYKTMEQFLDAAASSKRPFTASVSSPMSAAHAATVVLRERAKIPLKVVPFKGGGPARNAVAGGQVDCCVAPYWSAINVLDLTRALCIFWPKDPSKGLWDAPPAKEVLKFEMPNLSEPYAICVSAKTREQNPARYDQLVKSVSDMMSLASFRAETDKQQLTPFLQNLKPNECNNFTKDYLQMLASIKTSMENDLKTM